MATCLQVTFPDAYSRMDVTVFYIKISLKFAPDHGFVDANEVSSDKLGID